MPGIERTATAFAEACKAADVPFVIVGGFAVAAWGEPRATRDVDVLLLLPEGAAERLAKALEGVGLDASPQDLEDAWREGGHATAFDGSNGYHVDIKMARTPAEEEEVRAGVDIVLPSGSLRIVRPEEAIAFKLLYGSPLDLQDARSILARQKGRLDMARLARLAAKLGVSDALARATKDAEA